MQQQQQHSIFEPFFSFQLAHNMELMNMERQALIISHAPSHDHALAPHSWFTESPPPSTLSCIGIRTASCSSLPIIPNHASLLSSNLSMHHAKLSSSSSSTITHDQELLRSDSDCKAHDDGSVASKLLSTITKTMSSPSLKLASSKEAARETSYHKSLKLKHMKLQHCAEALGMESSDSSLSAGYDIISRSVPHDKLDMIGNLSTCCPSSSLPTKISNQEYSLPSVKSAPNLSAPPMMITTQHSKYTRCTSFPPPLSHTLPASPSCNSLSLSLRPYRQDGRFILKEVMVPSKNYFHADRRDGRLTLHVLTREDEDEENSASQFYHQQVISNESYELEDVIVKEGDILTPKESMISLDQTTQEELGSDDNENIVCTNRIHPIVEDVSVKASVDSVELVMGDFTELPIAAKVVTMKRVRIAVQGNHLNCSGVSAASSLLNLKRIQCNVAPHGHHLRYPATRNDKSNIISNVLALTLQTTNHVKLTLQKAQALTSLHSSRYPLSSGSYMKQPALIHPPCKSQILPPSHHGLSTFPESKENFIWESNLMPYVAVRRQKSILRRGEDATSFVLGELNANSLMKMVTGLATEGVSYDVRDWCTLTNRGKPSSEGNTTITDALHGGLDSSTIEDAYNALNSVIMGGGISGQEEHIVNYGCGGINTHLVSNLHQDEEKASIGNEAGKVSSSLYSTSALPPATATYLQISDEWLHTTLHCKELSERSQFGICNFMQPHSCIATRS